jgi:hypothetical protein
MNHRRRALRLAAEQAGPVPRQVYVAIAASGPCVYCGKPATTVDHVRPLSRGGHEAEYNLAPACSTCNRSKNAKLLIEWDAVKVAHGAAHSPVVAAELERELADRAAGYPLAGRSAVLAAACPAHPATSPGRSACTGRSAGTAGGAVLPAVPLASTWRQNGVPEDQRAS